MYLPRTYYQRRVPLAALELGFCHWCLLWLFHLHCQPFHIINGGIHLLPSMTRWDGVGWHLRRGGSCRRGGAAATSTT